MSRSSMNRKGGAGSSGGSRIVVMIVVLVLLVGVGTGIIFLMNSDLGKAGPDGSSSPAPTSPIMQETDKFYNGVFVDDIPLGGLTREEAKQKIEARQQEYVTKTGVTIAKDGKTWQIMISETAFSFDTDAVLDEAYKQGRIGTSEERKEAVDKLPDNPVKLATTVTVDPSGLEQKVRELAAPFAVAAQDASYKEYDETKPAGERLVFNPDVPGSRVDDDALWAAVQKEFTQRTFGTVQMQVVPVPATVTVASLQADMQLISQYETEIKNDTKARRTNITLAGNTIKGKILMPGETFSMNKATGERTEAKGYQDAPVDKNGVEDVGLAGGVCQVSGTLYNAAIAAGPNIIEIVERNHHSIPSAYMGLGKDATVDYPSKDLQFKNISNKPIMLIIYTDYVKGRKPYDYHERAEIYGAPDPEGATYELYCKKVKTEPKKTTDQPIYIPNKGVKPGQTKAVGGRDGIIVDAYLQKTDKNGTVTRTKLYQDHYPATSDVILYYYKDAKPTPTATPTETPTPAEGTPAPAVEPTAEPTPAPTEAPTEAPAV